MTPNENQVEVTILMPCLNEAETLAVCIEKARSFLEKHNIIGEVLIADNGSTDGSQQIAESLGARVVNIPERGYGAALIGGCAAAFGTYVIMGDADDSYDFTNLMPFVERLRAGDDLVMGNRFKGGIAKGAMPPLHRYLGNPVLSGLGRMFFKCPIQDFHCGLRGYNTERMRELGLRTTGMEYASEMVVQTTINGYKISEVPTTLSPDGRSRPPHLRSWRDGWRHLKFLLMHSPNWLFFAPGIFFFLLGFVATIVLSISNITIGNVHFGLNTMVYSVLLMIIGTNILSFWIITKVYAQQSGYIPVDENSLLTRFTAERGTILGIILIVTGIIFAVVALSIWGSHAFGAIAIEPVLYLTLPSLAFVSIGIELISTSFLADIIRIKGGKL